MMKVLVTGGLGFIGSNTCRRLLEAGEEVISYDISPLSEAIHRVDDYIDQYADFRVVQGDLRDKEAVAKQVKKVDFIIHLGGQVSHLLSQANPIYDLECNVIGTINILDAMKNYNPTAHLIYASSRSVYGRQDEQPIKEDVNIPMPIDNYGITKLAAEHYIRLGAHHDDLKVTILRQANVVGERQQLNQPIYQMISWVFRRVLLGETLRFMGDGTQTRDFLYVGDLVSAYTRCMGTEKAYGKIYNAGGLTYCSWADAIKTAEEVTQREARVVYVPHSTLRSKLENAHSRLACQKIQEEIGWMPVTTLKEAFRLMRVYYLGKEGRLERYI